MPLTPYKTTPNFTPRSTLASELAASSSLAHKAFMESPMPGLPFGTQRQRPGQSAPGMDPAGGMWFGSDPTRTNLGIPTRSPVLTWDNPFGVPMDARYVPGAQPQQQGQTTTFGMPKPESSGSAGLFSGPPKDAIKGTPFDMTAPTYGFDGRKMADGGMVHGPGTEKSDSVPAMLSKGEFVMPAETVRFFGTDRLQKMIAKSREDADEKTERHGAPDRAEDRREGEMGDMPLHLAQGGFVNPYADDPIAAAQREQEGKDARLAAIGGVDFGGGRAAFENKYGYGFTTPMNDKLAPSGPPAFETNSGTSRFGLTARLEPVPDIVPAGNPAAAPSLPFDRNKVATDFQNFVHGAITDAPAMRAFDFFDRTKNLALQPKGSPMITVPDATWKPAAGSPAPRPLNDGHFLAPWEKDAQARAARPSSAERRMAKEWTPVPGTDYMQSRRGQTLPKAKSELPAITPEMAAAMGLSLATADTSGRMTFRADGGKGAGAGIHATKEIDGVLYNMNKTGDLTRARLKDPTPEQKAAIFKHVKGRDPVSEADWTDAHYLATGDERPSGKPSDPVAGTQGKPAAPASTQSKIGNALSKFKLQ